MHAWKESLCDANEQKNESTKEALDVKPVKRREDIESTMRLQRLSEILKSHHHGNSTFTKRYTKTHQQPLRTANSYKRVVLHKKGLEVRYASKNKHMPPIFHFGVVLHTTLFSSKSKRNK